MPLLLLLPPLDVAWSMERCDMVVAGEEWNEGCVSAGVVAVIGDRLLASVVGMGCIALCWKYGPGFREPGVLLPPP